MTLEEAIEHAQGCVRNDVTSTSGLALIALLEAYNAKQDAQPVAIHDGWLRVPKEATPEMLSAFFAAPSLAEGWRDALAASPHPPDSRASREVIDERSAFDAWQDKGHRCGCSESMWTAWQARALLSSTPPDSSAAPIRWDLFPAWLIDHAEGETIYEETLQSYLSDMLASHTANPPAKQLAKKAKYGGPERGEEA